MKPAGSRFLLIALAILVAAAAGYVALTRWRVAREEREIAALKAKLELGGGDASEHHRLGLHLASQKEEDSALAHLEMAVEKEPAVLSYGNDVRLWSIRFKQYDRSIRLFKGLAARSGSSPETHLQLALAYVDKMPDHMMGIVGQSKLSNLSIRELTKLLENETSLGSPATHWATLYALGLNHLYWPKALRHAPAAASAFKRCIALEQTMKLDTPVPYFVLPYIALGDACVKDGRHDEGRTVWREALALFPAEHRLGERLAISDNAQLTKYVDKARGLGIPVDTDLAILWGRAP